MGSIRGLEKNGTRDELRMTGKMSHDAILEISTWSKSEQSERKRRCMEFLGRRRDIAQNMTHYSNFTLRFFLNSSKFPDTRIEP